MSEDRDNWQSYDAQIGDAYLNPVFRAGKAYLEAAVLICEKLEQDAQHWLAVPDWYVLHHLSVIACELFLKSMRVVVSHPSAKHEDGPDEWEYSHAYDGHHVKLGEIPMDTVLSLKLYLSEDRRKLLDSIQNRSEASAEIARGRYPYESVKGEARFPAGEKGKQKAEEWFQLAQTLLAFCKDEGGTPV